MLVPALFVAATAQAQSQNQYEVVVFVPPKHATPEEKAWAIQHGVEISENLDFSRLREIELPQTKRLSKMTLARLLLPEQLSQKYDRILYLDSDIVIQAEVERIFSLNTDDFALAAVPAARFWLNSSQIAHFRALGMSEPFRYFNSGVLYIDVDKWNRREVGQRALDFTKRNPRLCILPDEDALNAVLDGQIAELSPIWNMRARAWCHRRVRLSAQPVIVHYDGPNKPWRRFGHGQRLFEFERTYRLYKEFLVNSPWPHWLDDRWTVKDFRHNLAYEIGLWTGWLCGKEAPLRRLREERAYANGFLKYMAENRFTDIDQGIVERKGNRLQLAVRNCSNTSLELS